MSNATFESLVKSAFRFLVRDYGFCLHSVSFAPPERSVEFANVDKGVGVRILFEPNHVWVILCRLKAGEFWYNYDRLHRCDVNDFVPKKRWVRPLSESVHEHTTKRELARVFRSHIFECAKILKREASDILTGDFSRWDKFEARVLKKQRQRCELAQRGIKALAPSAVVRKLKARK